MKMKKYSIYIWTRWLVRFSVVLFIFSIAFSSIYINYKMSYNHPRLVSLANQHEGLRGYLILKGYEYFDLFYKHFENPLKAATVNNGTFFSISILGVDFSDPISVLSSLIQGQVTQLGYLLRGVTPLLLALLFGRFFCSWICPMSFVFAVSSKIRKLLLYLKIPLYSISFPRVTAGFVLVLGLILSYAYGHWIWHFLLPYITFGHEIFTWIVFGTLSAGYTYLIVLVFLDIMVFPGEFCRSFCPTGFLLAAVGKFSWLRLRNQDQLCLEKCQACNDVCPMSCFPKISDFKGCHQCGLCLTECPSDKLRISIH